MSKAKSQPRSLVRWANPKGSKRLNENSRVTIQTLAAPAKGSSTGPGGKGGTGGIQHPA